MHDPRFAAQLVEAQRQQSLILDADAADGSADVRTAPAYEQTVVAYDRRRCALREALSEVIGLTCPLERLHNTLPHFSPRRDAHTATMADKRALLAPLTDARAAGALAEAYAALVLREMAPVISAATGCDELLYAAVPTVRVQTPSDLATIRPHVDGMYDLPRGAANVWVPLTGPLEPSATLQLESAPGLADFAPLLPPDGAAVLFDGRRCLHYTLPNTSGRTRVSLDFRLVPLPRGGPERSRVLGGRLASLGYFSAARRRPGGAEWATTSVGRISSLHGLPHAAKPRAAPLAPL